MGNKNTISKTLTDKFILQLDEKLQLLKKDVLEVVVPESGGVVVFLSLCNGRDRASVIHERRDTLEDAWLAAANSAEKLIKRYNLKPLWAKADVVIHAIPVPSDLVEKIITGYRPYFMRKGISFDREFHSAYLEAELNGNGIINYKNNEINLLNLNNYQKKKGDTPTKNMPSTVIFFESQGFFCDENLQIYKLNTEEIDFGRRPSHASYEDILSAVNTASSFLLRSIHENGQFTYGYQPIFNKEIGSYNILRHTSTTWTLLNQYRLTKDENLVPKIEKAIRYMTENHIVSMNEDTCFLLEKNSSELNLGGNGIAVVVLCIYMEIFATDCFSHLVTRLGNGILHLQDKVAGDYYHVLNYPDFTLKDKYRTVYYDGEATFALSKLYSHTRDKLWLDAAMKAVDYFIDNNYERHVDHWIAYAVNELTLYVPSEKYLTFGLKNVQVNLDKIYNQDTSFHTYMELLMITFVLYDRIKTNGVPLEILNKEFDQPYFIRTIYKRATHMLNGYLYPEYAMYLKSPATILGAFCVRHHGCRVRIDDVQHFLGGYYLYLLNYDKLKAYAEELPI